MRMRFYLLLAIIAQTTSLSLLPSAGAEDVNNTPTPYLRISSPEANFTGPALQAITVRGSCPPGYGVSVMGHFKRDGNQSSPSLPLGSDAVCDQSGQFSVGVLPRPATGAMNSYSFQAKTVLLILRSPSGTLMTGVRDTRVLNLIEPPLNLSITGPTQIYSTATTISGTCRPGLSVQLVYSAVGATDPAQKTNFTCAATGTFSVPVSFHGVSDGAPVSAVATQTDSYFLRFNEVRRTWTYANNFTNRSNVLIIYNGNSPESRRLALYYQEKRKLRNVALCEVMMPLSRYAENREYDGMRRTIINNCVCNRVIIEGPGCSSANPEAAEKLSTIGTLVFMKGIPERMTFNIEDPILDAHLARYLFSRDLTLSEMMRPSESPLSFGRIDGVSEESTMRLIDRTLEAEKMGIQGNIISAGDKALFDAAQDVMTGNRGDTLCNMDDGKEWDSARCRVANNSAKSSTGVAIPGLLTNSSVAIPANTQVPKTLNVGGYWGGSVHSVYDQCGFSCLFQRMLEWRKTSAQCIPLCKNFPTELDRKNCQSRSTDVFKEINTDCVGVAPGAVGHIVRSYPVSGGSGLYPHGWSSEEMGHFEKTAPIILTDKTAYQDSKFLDQRYLRFGNHLQTPNAKCFDGSGTAFLCAPLLPIQLRHFANLQVDEGQQLAIRFRIRPHAGTRGVLYTTLNFYRNGTQTLEGISGNGLSSSSKTPDSIWIPFDLSSASSPDSRGWVTVELPIRTSFSNFSGVLDLRFVSHFQTGDAIRGSFDFDGIEVLVNGVNTLPLKIGSFDHTVETTSHGDYASEFIDRLGGVAWWGSTSHYRTGGFAFADSLNALRRFSQGYPLGKAVTQGPISSTATGLFFGDPLYLPSFARFDLIDGTVVNYGYTFRQSVPSSYIKTLFVTGKHGEQSAGSSWVVELCRNETLPSACNSSGKWETLASNQKSFPFKRILVKNLMFLVKNKNVAEKLILRIRLSNSKNPNPYYGLAYLNYDPN